MPGAWITIISLVRLLWWHYMESWSRKHKMYVVSFISYHKIECVFVHKLQKMTFYRYSVWLWSLAWHILNFFFDFDQKCLFMSFFQNVAVVLWLVLEGRICIICVFKLKLSYLCGISSIIISYFISHCTMKGCCFGLQVLLICRTSLPRSKYSRLRKARIGQWSALDNIIQLPLMPVVSVLFCIEILHGLSNFNIWQHFISV